jgi:hypothetical protein
MSFADTLEDLDAMNVAGTNAPQPADATPATRHRAGFGTQLVTLIRKLIRPGKHDERDELPQA